MTRDAAFVAVFIGAVFAICGTLGDYWIGFGISLMMALALTQSWSLFSSLSGYVSLGHVAFFGLGAYVVALTWGGISFPIAIGAAALAAAALAASIGSPVLRVKGPYFVILTLGLAELIKNGVIAIDAAQGQAGRLMLGVPSLKAIFVALTLLALLATALSWAVRTHRIGAGLRAIREDEIAAATVGIPVARFKLVAYVLSAIVPGAVGGVMALRSTYFDPAQAFDTSISFSMIAMAIIGGGDDLRGPVLGAVFLTVLSEILWARAPEAYMIVLGALLCLFVLFAPDGLLGRRRRRAIASASTPRALDVQAEAMDL